LLVVTCVKPALVSDWR